MLCEVFKNHADFDLYSAGCFGFKAKALGSGHINVFEFQFGLDSQQPACKLFEIALRLWCPAFHFDLVVAGLKGNNSNAVARD